MSFIIPTPLLYPNAPVRYSCCDVTPSAINTSCPVFSPVSHILQLKLSVLNTGFDVFPVYFAFPAMMLYSPLSGVYAT